MTQQHPQALSQTCTACRQALSSSPGTMESLVQVLALLQGLHAARGAIAGDDPAFSATLLVLS